MPVQRYPISVGTGAGLVHRVPGTTHTDIQAAVDAATAGDTLILDGVYACTATITVPKRLTLRGGGTLTWTAGVSAAAALLVTAGGCVIDNLRLVNDGVTGAQTGGDKQAGIRAQASQITVSGCLVQGFQQGIEIDAVDGEYQHIVITSNQVLDVQGAGDGAADDESENGEDRGDGITVWGSVATITGNVVRAAADTDARVGIHCEGLPGFNVTDPALTDTLCSITGNTVAGPFRRGITAEDMTACTISGNTVADSTWWAIAVVGSYGCTVTGNAILWTRTAADLHGEWWAPLRGPIACTRTSLGCVFVGNTVRAAATSAGHAFFMAKAEDTAIPTDILVQGNVFDVDDGAAITYGVISEANTLRLRVLDNTVRGFSLRGFWGFNAVDAEIRGNLIDGVTAESGSHGVHLSEDAGGPVAIIANTIRNVTTGIERANGQGAVICQNIIRDATNGIEGFGCWESLVCQNSVTVVGGFTITNITDGVDDNVVAQNVIGTTA